MRVLLIAESDTDLWKRNFYRDRILEAFPDAFVISACGEDDPSKHHDSSMDVYFRTKAKLGRSSELGAGDIRAVWPRQSLEFGVRRYAKQHF